MDGWMDGWMDGLNFDLLYNSYNIFSLLLDVVLTCRLFFIKCEYCHCCKLQDSLCFSR